MALRPRLLAILALVPLAMANGPCAQVPAVLEVPLELDTPALAPLQKSVAFDADVQPVVETRCVVCHACYDGPCQLLFSSYEGIERGATRMPVYDSTRLKAVAPTRLGIDAHDTAAWRKRGFFPVLGAPDTSSGDAAEASLVLQMLALGHAHPFQEGAQLPDTVKLDIGRTLTCPAPGEFDDYARNHPQGGMPYGMAPLPSEQLRVLASWVVQGAPPPPPPPPLPARAQEQVREWETLLNGTSTKQRIAARYLYEHLFLAHLVLDDLPAGPFFRVLRSRTAPGKAIDEIATVRPYDDPGTATFWYRLQPIRSTIVHKTHIVYPFGAAKQKRLRQLFLDSDWQPSRLPGYSQDEASNPFLAFDQIPPLVRYTFLLDDAEYFVMTFIRGPVCRGQIAVDVIEDQFWVAFLDPHRDLSVTDPTFLTEAAPLLSLPAEDAGETRPGKLWLAFNLDQHKYLDLREDRYDALDPEHKGPALDWIWDGGRENSNALLTVFRNYDNAAVLRGFVGETPKTAWIMDYPIFERIYYDLVAGFDVFGSLSHQVATRLYMDQLRMQSENLFLAFLPADQREEIRASWYRGAKLQVGYFLTDHLRSLHHGTQVHYTAGDPKAQLLEQIRAQAGPAAGPPDRLNRCANPPCDRPGASATEVAVERELQRIASVRGPWVHLLPEVSLVRVRVDPTEREDIVYALIHNAAHTNVAFMFGEDLRRRPKEDTLTVLPEAFGSYPNFFFDVEAAGIHDFVNALLATESDDDLERFVGRYGVRRTSDRFWATLDWLHGDLRRRDPTTAGLYDLGRYQNL